MENIELDLTSLNIFDSLKTVVLSSARHPESMLKCRGVSDDTRYLISTFEVKNLEFV